MRNENKKMPTNTNNIMKCFLRFFCEANNKPSDVHILINSGSCSLADK